MRLVVRDAAGSDYNRLVDSRLRVPGVLCISIDAAGRPAGVQLKVQSSDDFITVEPAPKAASIPLSTVAQLAGEPEPPAHRVRLHGSLSGAADSFVFRDATGSLPLRANSGSELATGSQLDLLAFVSREQGETILSEGVPLSKNSADDTPLRTLTTVSQIQNLSNRELSQVRTAQIEGTVTYSDPSVNDTFVQDETGGIFIFAPTGGKLDLKLGQFVRIKGFASAGGFALSFLSRRYRCWAQNHCLSPCRSTWSNS